ncbi:hypothetical protein BHE74_00013767, partial [Ensete ventricosum]
PPYKKSTPRLVLPRSKSIRPSAVFAPRPYSNTSNLELHFAVGTMAETKMAVVALLLVAMLVASTAPAADAFCFPDCYQRCANGQERNAACANMCVQACVVPTTLPDGTDLSKSVPGGK